MCYIPNKFLEEGGKMELKEGREENGERRKEEGRNREVGEELY
jgi:hypothetical protein